MPAETASRDTAWQDTAWQDTDSRDADGQGDILPVVRRQGVADSSLDSIRRGLDTEPIRYRGGSSGTGSSSLERVQKKSGPQIMFGRPFSPTHCQ